MKIITRAEAKSLGLKTYFTGKTCTRGGVAERLVSNKTCLCDQCKEATAARKHNWLQVNMDSVLRRNREWRGKNKDKVSEYNRRAYTNNREDRIHASREYYIKNRTSIQEANKIYRDKKRNLLARKKREYYLRNREKIRERGKAYYENNKEKFLKWVADRKAVKLQAVPSWFGEWDEFVIQEAYGLAAQRDAETGIKWHVDHMIPLRSRKACGLHCADNIQVIPAWMNLMKGRSLTITEPMEWIHQMRIFM